MSFFKIKNQAHSLGGCFAVSTCFCIHKVKFNSFGHKKKNFFWGGVRALQALVRYIGPEGL